MHNLLVINAMAELPALGRGISPVHIEILGRRCFC